MTVAGCYSLLLECDGGDQCASGGYEYDGQWRRYRINEYTAEKGSTCRRRARNVGWKFDEYTGIAWCPDCVKKGLHKHQAGSGRRISRRRKGETVGGTVAVCLREADGTEHRMNRWTNTLPRFFQNVKFFQKDKGHIKKYLSQWMSMKKDWEKNRSSGKFKHGMTEAYAPYPALLAPESYGIVVFDFMKDAVVSCQGYTGFGMCHVSYGKLMGDGDLFKEQVKLFKKGYVSQAFDWKMQPAAMPTSSDEFIARSATDPQRSLGFVKYKSNFNVIDFHDNAAGFKNALVEIDKLGFNLSAHEQDAWSNFIKEREEE